MKLKPHLVILTSLILASSCSEQVSQFVNSKNKFETQKTSVNEQSMQSTEKQKQLNEYILNLSDWSQVSPEKPDQKTKLKSQELTENIKLPNGKSVPTKCEVAQYDLTKTPDKIVMNNPAGGILYPGALVQGDGFLQGPGGIKELPIRKRQPVKVVIDLANENNSATMNQVDYAGFQKAYSEIIKNVKANQASIPSFVSFKQVEAQQFEAAALNLGFSVKYLTMDADGQLSVNQNSQEETYMAVFEQRAFTLSMVTPTTPADFFSSDFSIDGLKQQELLGNISNHNLPLYVSSVTYGRMLIFTIRSSASKEDIQGALKASYQNPLVKVKGDLKAKYQKIMNEASIQVVSMGGDTKNAESLIRNLNLNSYFSDTTSVDSFVPMNYVLRNLKDNSIAKVSETTHYTTKNCNTVLAKSFKVRITIEKIFMKYAGGYPKGEIYGDLSLNDQKIWSRVRDQYISTSSESNLETNLLQRPVEFILPENSYKPILLKAHFLDNDGPQKDDRLAEFSEQIGYDNNFHVKETGSYQTDSQSNVTIFYRLEKLEALY